MQYTSKYPAGKRQKKKNNETLLHANPMSYNKKTDDEIHS